MTVAVSDETTEGIDADWEPAMTQVAVFALERLRIHPDSELSIAFVDDEAMARMHVEWMDLPGPTDVLSFPMDEMVPPEVGEEPEPGVLGDIVLAPRFVAQQAAEHGVQAVTEAEMLTVHGVLHLLGYDHAEPDEERVMFDLQSAILAEYRAQVSPRPSAGGGA